MDRCVYVAGVYYITFLTLSFPNLPSPALVEMAETGVRPSVQDIRAWTRRVNSLTRILNRYADKDSLQQLSEQRQKLGDALDALGLDQKGRDKMRACQQLSNLISSPSV